MVRVSATLDLLLIPVQKWYNKWLTILENQMKILNII